VARWSTPLAAALLDGLGAGGAALVATQMARIIQQHDGGIERATALQRALNLTPRESDALFGIARGKSNRDASEIMNISARTVNKHLEQIFIKIGAAATAIATRIIAWES